MTATVHSGTGNFSFTNSTGGNVRVIIGHVLCSTDVFGNQQGIKMRFGPTNSDYVFQIQGGSNQQAYGTGRYITGANHSDGSYGVTAVGSEGGFIGGNKSGKESMFVSEVWLADAHSIDIKTLDESYPLKSWNILTIPE